ncbi:UDP-glucose:glycoprotein glucosyltransferase isoform X2 [Agrilus planipennis]|uniref:UDP-glucose:glycoprotein glucosyltransferase isoform X2 n=1 Tax=Agrilus planipennis TaxID=224129 RepID=A0A1W4XG73_AGRPL|nr:UDP-glucose:glycoprotein glucosyltransferase isoform X2 [Agrilus planipennis]
MKLLLVLLCLLSICDFNLLTAAGTRNKKAKSVTTLLNTKWRATPLALEAAEYLADENIDLYWSFIDGISNLKPALYEIGNEKQQYDKVTEIISKLVSSSQEMLLKFGLSLHIYSPKVEMFDQIAKEQDLPSCPIVVDVAGKFLCNLDEIERRIEDLQLESGSVKNPGFYRIDHHYPGSENKSVLAILYGELGTKAFPPFHEKLKNLALDGKIDYILRHYIEKRADKQLRLSGYGVELQMKSTEYKVQDDAQLHDSNEAQEGEDEEDAEVEGFNFAILKKLFPDVKKDLDKFKQHLEESSSEMAPLKVWQFQELSLQAAERIMSSPKDEVLNIFTHVSQNFPVLAKSLVKTVVKPELKSEILKNQDMFASILNLQPSDTALFINGMFFDVDLVDIYTLLEVMRQELRTMEGLFRFGFRNKTFTSLLSVDLNGPSETQDFAIDVRDSAVNWMNDIEKDSKYRRWPTTLMELLKPTFPGMLRQIRRNLFNLVLLIDPTSTALKDLLTLVESLLYQSAPFRIGVVFSVTANPSITGLDDAGVAMVCAYNYVSQEKSPLEAFTFLLSVLKSASGSSVTVDDVKKQLGQQFSVDVTDVLGEDSDYDFGRQLSEDFLQRSGLTPLPQALLNGVPLPSSQAILDDFEEAILQEVIVQTPIIQKAIFKGKLLDSDNVLDYLMSQQNVMPRLNQRILNKDSSSYLDMTGIAKTTMDVKDLLQMSKAEMTATAVENLKYFIIPKKSAKYFSMTYWIVGDLDCPKARDLLLTALLNMKINTESRVTFLPNVDGNKNNYLNKLVLAALEVLPPENATNFVTDLLKGDKINKYLENGKDIEVPAEVSSRIKSQELSLKMLRVYCKRVLNFKAGERGVIANGRILGPFGENETFNSDDFALFERFSYTVYGEKIEKALENNEEEEISSNNFLRAISMLISRSQIKSRFDIAYSGDEHSVIHLPAANSESPAFEITAVVDPVSRGAQKLGPILQVLQDVLNCNMKIFLNSAEKNSDMPLKSFYRFVLEPEIQFAEDGHQLPGPIAKFSNMPTAPLLTQNIHVPDNWLVEVVRAVYDLDNIRLENVDNVVHSEYELEFLLVEGHCFDATTGSAPRGLQITLGTEKKPVMVDTIVMANLGYFQLKANPGAWLLRLRQGKSADIYEIVGHEGSDTPQNSNDIKVLISSLRSNVIKLKVQKKPDKMHVDLLASDEENSGIWNSITSSFSGSDDDTDEKLNIFSVASGHLYERFLRIMMLSVIKHTKSAVKFWFLKNYLSPQLKDFLPYMAKEYGFEYELVQYKWPRWLHQQTEKQRTIWGYKILFLDVLFPLDVKKIIFVDADQVVRADLKELQQLDLGGAPYGYTPFCESRKEMEGFRFWKHGYWKNHLQGRKYHISALYVVHLKQFRRIAAGDRLRGQYQALSQDPNSLSNLDQDLPNNMIHQVAIKSLPQEWLWCETWCDDESKEKAKTIDLCNNPMTKEAKLSAAMRILPEWKEYDEEIRRLQKKIDSGVLDADVEDVDEGGSHNIHSEL